MLRQITNGKQVHKHWIKLLLATHMCKERFIWNDMWYSCSVSNLDIPWWKQKKRLTGSMNTCSFMERHSKVTQTAMAHSPPKCGERCLSHVTVMALVNGCTQGCIQW